MKNKRGDMPFWTVVGAILALIVLVILVIVFQKQFMQLANAIGDLIKQVVGQSGQLNIQELK